MFISINDSVFYNGHPQIKTNYYKYKMNWKKRRIWAQRRGGSFQTLKSKFVLLSATMWLNINNLLRKLLHTVQYVKFLYCKMPNLLIWRGRGYFSNMGMHLLIILCFSMFLSFNHLLFLSFFPFFFVYFSLSLLSITINRFPISGFSFILSLCIYISFYHLLILLHISCFTLLSATLYLMSFFVSSFFYLFLSFPPYIFTYISSIIPYIFA